MSSSKTCSVDGPVSAYDDPIDLAGDIALEDTDNLKFGMSFCHTPGNIGACFFICSQASNRDDMQGAVSRPITILVQTMTNCFSRRRWNRRDTAKGGEAGL